MLRTALCLLVPAFAATAQVIVPLSPLDTFHRTASDPFAVDSFAIPMLANGVQPGDWLRLRLVGDWDAGGSGDLVREMVGVFAGGGTLLASTLQLRVTAPAIAGTAYVPTSGTAVGNLPMDIQADFWIARQGASDEVTVRVPAGATYLYLAVPDSFYSDNSDPDGDLGVEITLVPPPPYPGTGGEDLILGSGVSGPLNLNPIKTAVSGNVVTAAVLSPLDLLPGTAIVLIVADVLPTATPPIGPLPGTWFSASVVIALVGVLQPLSPSNILSVPIPPGFAGSSLWLQGGALWAYARNGLFLTSEAHQIILQ